MERQKAIDRINKLIALSKNNPNEYEGLSAYRKAQELLEKYDLTMYDITGIRQIYQPVIEDVYYKPEEVKTPFMETWFGIILLLFLKLILATPVGWGIMYLSFTMLVK